MSSKAHLLALVLLAPFLGCDTNKAEVERLQREVEKQRNLAATAKSNTEVLRASEARNAEILAATTQRLSLLIARKDALRNRVLDAQRSIEFGGATILPSLADLVSQVETQLVEAEREVQRLQDAEQLNANYRKVLGEYQKVIASTKGELADLRSRVADLLAERDALSQRVAEQRMTIVSLQESAETLQRDTSQLQDQLGRISEDIKAAYALVARRSELRGLEARGQLIKKWKLLVPAPALLGVRQSSGVLSRFSATEGHVRLPGRWKSASVESIHQYFPDLFELRVSTDRGLALEVSDPAAFWGISRYLIVEVDP